MQIMACVMILFFGSLLITVAAGFPTAEEAPVSQDKDAVQRLKRQRSNEGVQSLLSGFAYTERMLLSCVSSTILPEVSGVSKQNCTSRDVSSTYKLLIAALDKVLRVYDLQERFLNQDKQNASVEMRALQIVIDTLVNQTCSWIESLGVHYSGGSESFSCSSGTDSVAQIRKLHALISAYQFVTEATMSTMNFVPGITQNLKNWLDHSGVHSDLTTLFTGTDYADHLTILPCGRCE